MPAAPVRVPRRRSSGVPDDIAHLNLDEVRDRLARNERVLGTALFSTSPTATATGQTTSRNPLSPTSPTSATSADDPVRCRLLAVRDALRAREAELLASSIDSMSLNSQNPPLATSPPTRSGKMRALETIAASEAVRGQNGISLPIQQTIALGTRDFDNQTAARLENLDLNPRRRQHRHVDDELGRAAAAAQYARAHVDDGDDDMFDTDEAYAAESVYASERHDPGTGLPLDTAKARRAEGMDEDLRSFAEDEDDSEFAEGNDEYEGDGRGTADAGPS